MRHDVGNNLALQRSQDRTLVVFSSAMSDNDNAISVERNRRGRGPDDDGTNDSDSCSSGKHSRDSRGSQPIAGSPSNVLRAEEQQRQEQRQLQNADLETTFQFNAMHYHHYVSETQRARSDVATVCSGSVIEDIEVESVMSQEENESCKLQQHQPQQQQHQRQDVASGIFYDEYQNHSSMRMHQKTAVSLDESAVDCGLDKAAQGQIYRDSGVERHQAFPAHVDKAYETPDADQAPVFSASLSSIALVLASGNYLNSCGMGPPLSRALLLDGVLPQFHHHHGSDSGSLLECDTRSNVSSTGNQDYDPAQPTYQASGTTENGCEEFEETAVDKVVRLRIHDSHSQSGSVKSYGSFNTVGDTDDCGGSLDVETHSIEAKSIHSQDDVAMSNNSVLSHRTNAAADAMPTSALAPEARSEEIEGGEAYNTYLIPNEGHEEANSNSFISENSITVTSANIDLPSMNESNYRWRFMHQIGNDYDPRQSNDDATRSGWDKPAHNQGHYGAFDASTTSNGGTSHSFRYPNMYQRGRRGSNVNDVEQNEKRDRSRSRDREDEK